MIISKKERMGFPVERLTMNVAELAQQLGVSKPTAYALAKRDDFPSIKLGKRIVVPISGFQKWLSTSANKYPPGVAGGFTYAGKALWYYQRLKALMRSASCVGLVTCHP